MLDSTFVHILVYSHMHIHTYMYMYEINILVIINLLLVLLDFTLPITCIDLLIITVEKIMNFE